MQSQVIEDIFANAAPPQPAQFVPPTAQPQHPSFGLQLPQPLKQSGSFVHSAQAPINTITGFGNQAQFSDNVQSSAFQSSAIRGRVTSPHVYQWDATPSQDRSTDFGVHSGMKPAALAAAYGQQPSLHQAFPTTTDPHQILRDAIAGLYKNAMLLKTHQYGNFSVYKCPVENMTSGNYKYIVAIVPNHDFVALGTYYSLQSLPWVSFQTRQTDNPAAEFGNNRPQPLRYGIPSNAKSALYDRIKKVYEDKQQFVYLADTMPCKVELLKLREGDFAGESSTLLAALEAYKTIVTME